MYEIKEIKQRKKSSLHFTKQSLHFMQMQERRLTTMEIGIMDCDDHHYKAIKEIPNKLIGNIETLVVIKYETQIHALLATKNPVMESKIRKLFGYNGIIISTIRKSALNIKKKEMLEDTEVKILINI